MFLSVQTEEGALRFAHHNITAVETDQNVRTNTVQIKEDRHTELEDRR